MGKKNKDGRRHISEVGNYGDEREYYASKYVFEQIQTQTQTQAQHATTTTTMTPLPNNDRRPDAVLKALEDFDIRWTMLHLGKEKGEYLDKALQECILSERKRREERSGSSSSLLSNNNNLSASSRFQFRALEVGTYIGYSAVRLGRILASTAETADHNHNGSYTLLSVEQNQDNANYAKTMIDYAGLNKTVKILHSNIENMNICFDEYDDDDDNDNNNNNDEEATVVASNNEINGVVGNINTVENTTTSINTSSSSLLPNNNNRCRRKHKRRRPYDFVFFDHRKPFYLTHLKLLEAKGYIDSTLTTVVADNIASIIHIKNRKDAIAKGKRRGSCHCTNQACNYLEYMKQHWSSNEIFYGTTTKDGISVSRPY